MIEHLIGEDSRHAWIATDDDVDGDPVIYPAAAEFTVTNAAGVDIIEWTDADPEVDLGVEADDDTFTVAVALADDLTRTTDDQPVETGNYAYVVRWQDTGNDWFIAAAGLLTVRNP